MRTFIASIPNWHRYVIGAVIVAQAILAAIIAAPALVPPALEDIVGWAPFAELILGAFLAALPRAQLPTGPGAPAIVSPPPKDDIVPHG